MKEEEIVKLLLERPDEGMAAAMESYGEKVRWMTGNILGRNRAEDIEECVSDIFVKLWKSIGDYDSRRGSLLAWIYGIARHTAIDRLRQLSGREQLLTSEEEAGESLGVTPDFLEQVAQRENARLIRQTVHAMKQPDRNIFLLRYFYFLPVKEIAGKLGLTEKQVENRLRRGRQRLKKELTERGVIL